jgi:hypothetical protein
MVINRIRISRLLFLPAFAVLGVVPSSGIVWARTPPPADTFKVSYFSNANTAGVPDGTVYLTNPGTSGGNICAMIYVLDPNQELSECCGCSLSPDSLLTLSINSDLTSSPLTREVLTSGTIMIVSSSGAPACNPSKPVPTPAVRGWATHIQSLAGFPPYVTEAAFQDAALSTHEERDLKNLCSMIVNGSGFSGICNCGTTGE